MPSARPSKAVLLFHRGHEHSGRWSATVEALANEETAFFAWDQRGHGRSPGERGGARSIADVVRDAECFARHVAAAHGIPTSDTAVVAHSVGAVIAAAWVHDYAPPVRGIVLAAPAFRVRLYVPFAVPLLRLRQRVFGPGTVKSYVRSRMLSSDPAEAAAYDADPLIFRQIAVNVLLELHDLSTRIVNDAGAIVAPTLVVAAERDWVVQLPAQERFYGRLGSTVKELEVYPGMKHAMFHDAGRAPLIERVRAFLARCFVSEPARGDLLHADRGGFTKTEYDLLRTPPSLRWRTTRRVLSTAGRVSDGIDLGWRHGFDSGLMLDYVYRNEPRGRAGLGRLVDRIFLESPGWAGIRARRAHLEEALRQAIDALKEAGQPVHILDIAAGPGRYVLETIAAMRRTNGTVATALLRDWTEANLLEARRLARTLGVEGVNIERGDAFDRASLSALEPKPTIAIASGIYELFPENEPVLASLRGIAHALPRDGRLIYTCQPWHPQLEFIARTLRNSAGAPWVMRRRTQAEMDELVRAAGFAKLDQRIDDAGIFTVSVARRT
jgi:alpha-beta hydrolase superfamily lysophospholipase